MYASRGEGCRIWDVDGNEHIDMICALGAIALGYGAIEQGTAESYDGGLYSLPSFLEVTTAELVLSHVAPWASSVRFVKTGSESTHAAYRIAKRATGRPFVLVGDWAYHGWHEWCERRPNRQPELFHTILYKHCERFDQTLGHGVHPLNVDPEEVAAIFIEPHRWELVDPAWLRFVREFCSAHGIVLVFDDMIYGGRFSLGGATELFGVTPDLACFGKAFANGAPVAFVVGREALQEHGELVSGTYSGETYGLAACAATIRTYAQSPVIETLWERGEQLQAGLRDVVKASPVTVALEGAPVHQRLRFGDPANGKKFAAAMAQRGVLWHPDVVNVMAAHEPADIDAVISAAHEAIQGLA